MPRKGGEPAAASGSKIPVQDVPESEQRYLGLLELSGQAVLVVSDLRIVLASPAACALLGVDGPEALLTRPVLDFIHEKYRNAVTERIGALAGPGATAPFVHRKLQHASGQLIDVEIALHACRFHGAPAVQMLLRDVTAAQSLQAQLTRLTQYDPLTELANRSQFLDRLEGAIARAARAKQMLGLLCVGLDHFRDINDRFGQKGGDVLLMQVAERLKKNVRKSDTLARLGGDEFCVILEGLLAKDGASIAAQRNLSLIAQPFLLDGMDVAITASIGIAILPVDAQDLNSLLKHASLALKYAKQHGRNQCQFYAPELDALGRSRTQLRAEIEQRLERLTPREREVLDLLIVGKASKMIAYTLGISSRTIDIHRGRVMEKMQADSLAELVHMVRELQS